MIAGVITLTCGACSPFALFLLAPASGMPMMTRSSATSGPTAPATISAPRPPIHGHQRGHDRWRHRAADEAGKGVDRKRAAHPRFVHMRRQDRVIGRVIDAVGEAEQRGADDQRRIAQMHAEPDQRKAAEAKPAQEDFARADVVGEIADRRLRQAGDRPRTRSARSRARYSRRRAGFSGTETASAARTYGNG